MVVIQHCVLHTLNAYAVSPLTPEMTATVQHRFYDGTYARYGDQQVHVNIHDRPEFHGMSHYDLRVALDNEGALEEFLIIDERTPELDAVWYVEDTESCKADSDPADFLPGQYPVVYPGEDFILWQAHLKTADVPQKWASWDVGCSDLQEAVANHYWPYDPHDPQDEVISMGFDWKDLRAASHQWGFAYIRASWDEVEWSTDPADRRHILPRPPIVARLTARAATESGLLQSWMPKQEQGSPGEEVDLIANYDWESPIWPTGYPDDPSDAGAIDTLKQTSISRVLNASIPTDGCSLRSSQRKNLCARICKLDNSGNFETQ